MKIKRGKNNIVKFGELESGDVFEFNGYIYIKIDDSNFKNAYNLVLNLPTLFQNGEEEVIKLQAELSVR